MITREFIEAANAAAAKAGFINPDFRAATKDDKTAYAFCCYYCYNGVNSRGEKMVIEVTMGEDTGGNDSLPPLWHKAGHTPTILRRYWCISSHVTDEAGDCRQRYNPQHTAEYKINFAYMLEATPGNLTIILRECARRFNEAK